MNLKTFVFGASILALAACGDSEQNAASLNGANFVSKQGDVTITLSFDADEMRANGRVVNLYNGSYSAEGNKIQFGQIASTMMMGPQEAMEVEQEYFKFLDAVESYDLSKGRLTLRDASGAEIVFEQVDELPSEE